MRAAKNKYVVIEWIDGRWKPVTKKRENFREHKEEFDDLVATGWLNEPPRHFKSIHVCWLSDLKYWDGPNGESPFETESRSEHPTQEQIEDAAIRSMRNFGYPDVNQIHLVDVDESSLDPHDRRELRRFKKFLVARQRYGEEVLLKRPFWRKYLGLE